MVSRHKLEGHSAAVIRCKYTADGSLLITCSWDTRVNLWDAYSGRLVVTCLTSNDWSPNPRIFSVYSGTQVKDVDCDATCSALSGKLSQHQTLSTSVSDYRVTALSPI